MTATIVMADRMPRTGNVNGTRRGSNGRSLPVAFHLSGLAAPEDRTEDARRILDAAIAILDQGEGLLRALSVESYVRRVPLVFNACIGGHYRHCLDHFTRLLQGLETGEVDYDHRERDARIESQPDFALSLTRQLRAQIEQLPLDMLDLPVQARCEVSYAHGDSPVTGSTFGREIVYAIAHAIHHYALISIMARLMDAKLPDHFGVAPSTVAHQAKLQSCPTSHRFGFRLVFRTGCRLPRPRLSHCLPCFRKMCRR